VGTEADDDLQALFDGRPEGFITGRDALAKRLKADGNAAMATEVKAFKRPTVVAWAVNRLALRRGDDVARLLEAGAVLRQSQRLAVSGSRESGLRQAAEARRAAIEALAAMASDLVADDASPLTAAQRSAVVNTLEAASAGANAADLVLSGRLQKQLEAPAGFGDLGGLEALQGDSEEPTAQAPDGPDDAQGDAEAREARERALADARAAVAAAEADATEARDVATRTRDELTAVEKQLAALQARADDLRARSSDDGRQATAATEALEDAQLHLDSLL